MIPLLGFLLIAGCETGVLGSVRTPVSSVTVIPDSDTTAIGESVELAAVVEDANGNELPGREVFWASEDSTIASVSPTGRVMTHALGTVRIAASSEGESGLAIITVERNDPARLERFDGDNQDGTVGQPLPDPLIVRITDADGSPVAGVAVAWETADGDGSLEPASVSTDSDGLASAEWTLGTAAGPQSATAVLPDWPDIQPVAFAAGASADNAATLTRVSPLDEQTGTVGEPIPEPLVVYAEDQYGNPVAGVEISWSAEPGGSFEPSSGATDADGVARTTWTLTGEAGPTRATARAGNLDPVTFDATAEPGPPAKIEKIDGDGQSGPVGEPLDDPLIVQVLDEYDNPLAGYTVIWLSQYGGFFNPVMSQTDSDGQAQARWLITRLGLNEAVATVENLNLATTFSATGNLGGDEDDDDNGDD